MSDGRATRGPLYELVRSRFGLTIDLDLCARIYGESGSVRSVFAQFAVLVHEAAQAGDAQAIAIFDRAAEELVECVAAVRRSLAVPDGEVIPVSHSGGVFNGAAFSRDAFRSLWRPRIRASNTARRCTRLRLALRYMQLSSRLSRSMNRRSKH